MGKDILTPNKIQTYAERDYSTPKAHCDLSVLQEAEEKNSLSKINTEHDPEYIALLNEKSKMQQEGVLANRKPPSEKPLEREVIETFLINREFKIDEKIRTNKEKKYPIPLETYYYF